MEDRRDGEFEAALRGRSHAEAWQPGEEPDTWVACTEDGSKRGEIREVAGEFEARVFRAQTGPTPGPDPEPSNGPQVFDTPREALDYAEANMGW